MADTTHDKLIDENSIYILDEFDFELNEKVIIPFKALIEKNADKKNAKINVFINSNGGYTCILFSLIDLIEIAKKKGITVRTIVSGRAYSCGSMLAIAGTQGERYISENAEHLMHYGTAWAKVHTPKQVERESRYLKRHFARLVAHYKKHTKMTQKQIEKKIDDDSYYVDAQGSIKLGLADKLLSEIEL